MQTQEDKRRITIIGAASSRVNRMGNLKYDYQPTQSSQQKDVIQLVRTTMKTNNDELLWVCGSTREGEEEILLDIFKTLSESSSLLKLVLAPRHPHRTQDICKLIEQHKFTYLKRSLLLNQLPSTPQILILDTIGELSSKKSLPTFKIRMRPSK
jgi:3-deoxy-D-manno-octulosonic-acid transferase